MCDLRYEGKPSAPASTLFEFLRAKKTAEMRTNSVFTPGVLTEKCENGEAWITIGEDAAVILCPDTENILRLYYYASDSKGIHEVRRLLPHTEERFVADIIGREPRAGQQATELSEAGFVIYEKFQRMMCSSLELPGEEKLDFSGVEFAKREDAYEISELTHQEFDPLTARMHTVEQLEEMIDARELLVVRKDGLIAGFTLFDSIGKRVALLDHVIVRPEYRREKIGRRILAYKWKYANDSQHYVLWVNVKCAAAIHYHETNGFHSDGTYDYILKTQE